MKKVLFTFALLLGLSSSIWAYDFSAVAPSGQTLYYQIRSNGTSVNVVWPNASATTASDTWTGYTQPSGALIIPNFVTYGGQTYTVKGIGTAFYQCTDLTSVVIADSITGIAINAFKGCTGLTSLVLGSTIKYIGGSAFMGCTGLSSITIPPSVDSIAPNAFGNCTSLTSVNFNADSCIFARGYNGINQGMRSAFYGCTNLTNINFGSNIKRIPDCICCGLSTITSVTIPNSVISIGSSAFEECTGITSVTIPNSVTSIDYYAFFGCTGITSAVYNNTLFVLLPQSYNGSYSIPSGITTICDCAFYGCSGLTSVTIPNSVTSIDGYVFYDCSGLASITIPNSVTTIGFGSFAGCSGLASITIPNSVNSIGGSAFSNCSSLTSITIPNPVTSIGDDTFNGCSSLTSVTIPNSVTSIGVRAFRDCSGLTSVTIGSSVASIGEAAFMSCSGLTEIHTLAQMAPTLVNNTFAGVSRSIPVYVPCGREAHYYSQWSYFSNIIEEEPFSFNAESADNNMGVVQILTMPTCTAPNAVLYASANSGYRFDHWSTGSTSNPYTLTVTTDTIITAYFVSEGPQMFTISTAVNDPLMGSVTGGGEYAEGSTVTLTAVPNSGYTFALWLDGNTNNPRTITVTEDATYTAVFQESNGIIDVDGNNIHIYTEGGNIVVKGAENEKVQVFDMVGRPVGTQSLPTGVYMVKVGTLPARKVVVVR